MNSDMAVVFRPRRGQLAAAGRCSVKKRRVHDVVWCLVEGAKANKSYAG